MTASSPILLYGATGRAASLILELARERGVRLIIAGRDESAVETLAARHGLDARHFGLDVPSTIDACLEGVRVVLNCAGPFDTTAIPLVEACLRTGTHYLDLSADAPTIASIRARSDEAASRGVMLLPSVGFASVAPDCLAVHLTHLVPTASRLDLVLPGVQGRRAPFEARPLTLDAGRLAAPVPPTGARRFSLGRETLVAAPLSHGALVVAHASTGVADIACWRETSRWGAALQDVARWVGVVDRRGVLTGLAGRVGGRLATLHPAPTGTDDAAWLGIASHRGTTLAAVRLEAGSVDRFTAHAALQATQRAGLAAPRPGFQTVAGIFGPDIVLGLPGVRRVQLLPLNTPGTQPRQRREAQG